MSDKKILEHMLDIARLGGRAVMPVVRKNKKIESMVLDLFNRLRSATVLSVSDELLASIRNLKDIKGEKGLNIAGYINAESGVGEAVRSNIKAVEAAGIPFVLNNISSPSRQGDRMYTDFTDKNPYCFNLIQANPDNFLTLLEEKSIEYFVNKYNIGFWYWELSEFPRQWDYCFNYFNEVWVASTFCLDAVSRVSPVPVFKVPPSVAVDKMKDVGRGHFGLGADDFIFLFMFDLFSFYERKNPLGLINAFRKAFRPGEKVQLVLKCSNLESNKEARDRIRKAAQGLNVKIIDGYFDKDEIHALMKSSDCYVSLHRSEGFGLPLAEAMYLGKPVIATNYSGNTDFMNEKNSFPIRYKLVEIEQDFGPYKKGNVWAEPDTDHAAEAMRLVYEKRELAKSVGQAASDHIKREYNAAVCGQRILDRLEAISREKLAFKS